MAQTRATWSQISGCFCHHSIDVDRRVKRRLWGHSVRALHPSWGSRWGCPAGGRRGDGTGRDGAASAARPPAEGARAPPSRRRETSAPRKSLPLAKGESCGPSWRCHGHVEVRESICRGGTVSQTCLWAFAVFTLEGNLLKAFKLGRWNKWWCLLSQIANMQQHNCYSHSPHLPRLSPCCREPYLSPSHRGRFQQEVFIIYIGKQLQHLDGPWVALSPLLQKKKRRKHCEFSRAF